MRALGKHNIPLAGGLNTRSSPITQALKTLLTAQNVDGFDTFLGAGTIPGTTRVSADFGSAVKSLHQFEYFDLGSVLQREQLGLGNGTLAKINADKTLTTLQSSMVDERLHAATLLDRIHLTGPSQRQLATGGLKYDGTAASNWGVLAPGQIPTVVQALDTPANWAGSTDVAALTADTTNTIDGTAAIVMDKTGTTEAFGYIQRTGQADDISSIGEDTLFLWVFIPAGTLQKTATSGTALEVRFGGAGLTDADRHAFSIGDLVPGWNLLSMVTTSPSSQDGAGATLSAIDTWRFTYNFTGAAQTQSGFLFDRLHYNNESRVTAALADSDGALVGSFTYRVTYLTEYGQESNAGTSSDSITAATEAAVGTLTFSAQPSDGDTVTIDSTVYTFKTTLTPTAFEVLRGASATASRDNLVDAINLTGSIGTDYAAGTTEHPTVSAAASGSDLLATAETAGTAGNTIATTETSANLSWGGATLSGGRDGDQINLTAVPTSTDTQVIARRIYRDDAGDNVWRFLAQIDDNTTTTYADNTAQASLGLGTPPIAGDTLIDSTPPRRMRDVIVHESRIIGIDADNPFILLVSDVNLPESFPLVNEIQIENELIALEEHALGTMAYGSDRAYLITGDGVNRPIRVDLANRQLGANSPEAVAGVKGTNVVFRENELFVVANPTDPWWISGPIHDQLLALTDFQSVHLIHDRARFRVILFSALSPSEGIFVYQYGHSGFQQVTGDGSGTDPQDLRVGTWWKMTLPTAVAPACSEIVERTAELPELWIGGADGYVYWFDPSATTFANALSTAAISQSLETAAIPLGLDKGGRGEPRFVQLETQSTAGATWTVTVTLLSDAAGATIGTPSTFSLTVPAGAGSPIVPIPDVGDRGSWVKIKLTNATSGEETTFTGPLTLYYIPRSSFRGPRTS